MNLNDRIDYSFERKKKKTSLNMQKKKMKNF